MKIVSMLPGHFWRIALMIIVLIGCEQAEMIPVDDYYKYDKLARLVMEKPAKVNYFLGIDNDIVPLSVALYEANGALIKTPQQVVRFYANDKMLPAEAFLPDKAGVFKLVGRLAGKVSDTIQVRVWDPALLTIRISVVNKVAKEFFANGSDTVSFKVDLMHGTEVIDGDFPLLIYANDKQITTSFSTSVIGEYKFVAKGFGLSSNQIILKAVSPPSYGVVRLPVIFHEVNRSQLTAARVKELTEGMTRAYRNNLNRANKSKDANATDLYVEFFPAPTGLDGRVLSTPGLDKVVSLKTSFSQEDAYTDSFSYFWDPDKVINVWVYPNITGTYANSSWAYNPFVTQGLAGLSTVGKGTKPFLPFGIFLNANHLVDQNTDEILAHEAGHLLGLAHVFAGNGSVFNGCPAADPDYCSDTPYYNREDYSKNIPVPYTERFKRVSCSGEQYEATNYMDYYYAYNNSFTVEQGRRVRHAINYALWLPTPFNGFQNGRSITALSLVEKPVDLKYFEPIVCEMP